MRWWSLLPFGNQKWQSTIAYLLIMCPLKHQCIEDVQLELLITGGYCDIIINVITIIILLLLLLLLLSLQITIITIMTNYYYYYYHYKLLLSLQIITIIAILLPLLLSLLLLIWLLLSLLSLFLYIYIQQPSKQMPISMCPWYFDGPCRLLHGLDLVVSCVSVWKGSAGQSN
jgi:hypothetical protein